MQPEIDNINHPLMLLTSALLTDAGRKQHQQFLIDDPENIAQALAAGIDVTHVFFYGDHGDKHLEFVDQLPSDIETFPIRPRTCKKIFGTEKTARVFAIANMPVPKKLDALAATSGDVVVLDGLMITGNIGAIMRSALAFDVGAIALLNLDYHALYDRRLIRASKGYVFKLPVVCAPSSDFFNYCRKQQIKILNCSHTATDNIDAVAGYAGRLAIVLGAEKQGISAETETQADFTVKIPFNTEVESLNVSVAAGIVLYARRQAKD